MKHFDIALYAMHTTRRFACSKISALLLFITLLTLSTHSEAQSIFFENFDGAVFPPTGWTNTLVTNNGTDCTGGLLVWQQSTTGVAPTSCDFLTIPSGHSGAHAALYNSWDINYGGQADLATPGINLNAYPNGLFQVSFWTYRDYGDPINIYVNTSPTSAGATLLGTLSGSTYDANYNLVWQNTTYNIPSAFSTGTIYIIFQGYSYWEQDNFLDDVNMIYIGPCSGTPLSPFVTTAPLSAPICSGYNTTIVANDTNIAGGLNNYWQQSTTGLPGSWVNIPNSTGLTYTTPALTSTMYYRVADSCALSNQVSYSSTYSVPVNTYSIPYYEDFSTTLNTFIPDCYTENITSSGQSRWETNTTFHDALGNSYGAVMSEDDIQGNYQSGKNAFFTLPALNLNAGEVYQIQFGYERGRSDANTTNIGNTYPENLQLFVNYAVQPSTSGPGSPGGTSLFNSTITVEGHNTASLTFTPTVSGAYFFSWYSNTPHPVGGINAAGGLVAVDTIKIDSFGCTPPIITFPPQNSAVCIGNTATLSVTATGYELTYQWYRNGSLITGATNSILTIPNAQPADAANYKVIVTGSCGGVQSVQSNTVSLTVSDYPAVTVAANGPTTVCAGNSVVLTSNSDPSYNYQWMVDGNFIPNAFNVTDTIISGGSYQSVVTNTFGCTTTSAPVAVNVLSSSSITITPSGSTTFCVGQNVTLTANYDSTIQYNWLDNGQPLVPAVTTNVLTTNTPGNYTIVETAPNGCTVQFPTPVSVVVNGPAAPPVLAAGGPLAFCLGGFVTLSTPDSSSLGYTYQWYKDSVAIAGATSISYTASATGAYQVQVSQNNCALGSTIDSVNVDAPPTTITNNGTIICSGNTIVLTAPAGPNLSYLWYNNGVPTSVTTQTLSTDTGGIYQVQVSDISCTNLSSGVTITVGAPPSAVLLASGPTTVCPGDSVTIHANLDTSLNYTWSVSPNGTPGTYTQLPYITANGHYDSVRTFYATGYYIVTEANGPCQSSSFPIPVTISPKPIPVITASGSTSLCPGGSVTLATQTGNSLTYQWYQISGANTTPISNAISSSLNANSAGVYEVVATNAIGCTGTSQPVNITSYPNPTALITSLSSDSICLGSSVTLSAGTGAGYTYQWMLNNNPIASATGSTYNANAAGTYKVVVTSGAGCTASSNQRSVTTLPVPPNNIFSSGSTSFCTGDSVVLSAATGSNLSYQWELNNAPIPGATAHTYVANTAGNYRVVVSNGSCLAASVNAPVSVSIPPVLTIVPAGNTTVCTGNSVSLSVISNATGYNFQWQRNGSNIPNAGSTSYAATATGNYSVVASGNNCIASSPSQYVKVNPLPVDNVVLAPGSKNPTCAGTPAVLNDMLMYPGFTYQWSLNGASIPGTNSDTYPASDSGSYTVTVTDTNGCTNTSSAYHVALHALPDPTVAVNGSVLSTGTFVHYQWFLNDVAIPNDTTNSINITQSGKYKVEVTDGFGCSATSNETNVKGVGVENVVNGNDIKVYPNPATSIVHIDAPVVVNVSVAGIDGKEILRNNNVKQVDISGLANGVYMITIYDEHNNVLKIDKLVKTAW